MKSQKNFYKKRSIKTIEKIKSFWNRLPLWIKAFMFVVLLVCGLLIGGHEWIFPPVIEPETPPTGATTETITLLPNGQGDLTEWYGVVGASSHWEACKTNDGDTSYIHTRTLTDSSSPAPYQRDLFHAEDPPAEYENYEIISVKIIITARSTSDTYKGKARPLLKTHGTIYAGEENIPPTTYTNYSAIYETNPYTGESWTWNEITELQIGVKGISGMRASGFPPKYNWYEVRCTLVLIEVNCIPPPKTDYSWQNKVIMTSDRTVHIVYDNCWKYKYFDSKAWTTHVLSMREPAIDKFSNDTVVIVYKDDVGNLKYRICPVDKSSDPWTWTLGDEQNVSVVANYFDVATYESEMIYIAASNNSDCFLAYYNISTSSWNFVNLNTYFDPNSTFNIGQFSNYLFIWGTNATKENPSYLKAIKWKITENTLVQNATVSHVEVAGMGDFICAENGKIMQVYSDGEYLWVRKGKFSYDIETWESPVCISEGNIKSPDQVQVISWGIFLFKVYYVSNVSSEYGDLVCRWTQDGGSTWSALYAITWSSENVTNPNVGKRYVDSYYPLFFINGSKIVLRYENVLFPSTIECDYEALDHSYGRKMDIALGRLWIFYSNDKKICYRSVNLTNFLWTEEEVLEDNPAQEYHGWTFYIYIENRSGTYYLHYVRCFEEEGYNEVCYRRGKLHADGTIEWTPLQEVIPANDTVTQYVCGVTTDSEGYPYILYGKFEKRIFLIKSDLNNGTWHTASGFPVQLNTQVAGNYQFSGNVWQFGNGVYCIYQNGGLKPFGRYWNGTTLLDEENITDIEVWTEHGNYKFSSSIDKEGKIHYAYICSNGSVIYTVRNSSGWSQPQVIYDSGDYLTIHAWENVYVFIESTDIIQVKKSGGNWWKSNAFGTTNEEPDCFTSTVRNDQETNKPLIAFVQSSNIVFRYADGVMPNYKRNPIPPISSNVSVSDNFAGSICTFQAFWESDVVAEIALDTALFYWNASGTWQLNGTYTFPTDTTEGWSNFSRVLPDQSGIVVAWYIICNDTQQQWGNTTTQYLEVIKYTELTVGWNSFVAWNEDIGHTLAEVNASLHIDNINWTVISLEYSNGSRAVLVWEQDTNEYIGQENAVVESGCTFYIYCLEEGKWYHNYQGA